MRKYFCIPVLIKGGKAINIVSDSCVAFGDTKILPGIDKQYLEKEIKKKINQLVVKYKITTVVYVPATLIKPSEPIVQILKRNSKQNIILRKELIAEERALGVICGCLLKKKYPPLILAVMGLDFLR